MIKKVILIEPCSPGFTFFSFSKTPLLGLPILGAILKEMGIQVKIFCENLSPLSPINWREVAEADLVGISVLTPLAPRGYELTKRIKEMAKEAERSISVVMGGPHPTAMPEEALKAGADFVIRHEGEFPLRKLIESLNRNGNYTDIKGLSYWEQGEIKHNPAHPFVSDLSEIPCPDFSLIENFEKMNIVPYQTSRGCPFDCEYCSVTEMFGKKIRYRDPEVVAEDLQDLAKEKKHIFIVDDNFSQDRERTINLLETLKESGFKSPWTTQERVEVAEEEKILSLMRETGCKRLCLGVESFSVGQLEDWDKRQTPEEIKKAIDTVKKFGIDVHGMFVLGGDADDEESIKETIDESTRVGLDTAQFFALVPIPGTKTFQELEAENRILNNDWGRYDGMHVVFSPKNLSVKLLQELTLRAYDKFYRTRRAFQWLIKKRPDNMIRFLYARWALGKWRSENSF